MRKGPAERLLRSFPRRFAGTTDGWQEGTARHSLQKALTPNARNSERKKTRARRQNSARGAQLWPHFTPGNTESPGSQ